MIAHGLPVYVALARVDMRLGYERLGGLVREKPCWPRERYLELAPNNWLATRAKLHPDELNAPLCSFTIPAA